MKNILVTIDFDGKEQILLDKAYQFASVFNSKVWIMHIAAPDPDFVGYSVGPQYIRDSRAEELRNEHRILQDFSRTLNERGVETDALLVDGATIEMIMKEAEKLNADLIITGHNDHGFFYKAFIGSTSEQIIAKSKIPVLLVPLDR
ncbi:universal stress protein [Formosa haliotis]|uniref:universal stress protein n=1 Tax=Formosa haliotis TaxID=1555194 RepID=UPI0008247BC5|nr:universal stress protein [Formosa haliotis]